MVKKILAVYLALWVGAPAVVMAEEAETFPDYVVLPVEAGIAVPALRHCSAPTPGPDAGVDAGVDGGTGPDPDAAVGQDAAVDDGAGDSGGCSTAATGSCPFILRISSCRRSM